MIIDGIEQAKSQSSILIEVVSMFGYWKVFSMRVRSFLIAEVFLHQAGPNGIHDGFHHMA